MAVQKKEDISQINRRQKIKQMNRIKLQRQDKININDIDSKWLHSSND